MRTTKLSWFPRLIGVLAAVAAAAGISLECWCASDRARGGGVLDSPDAAVHAVFARPSAATFSRLARVNAAVGNAKGAAYAATVAARIKPDDPILAAEAEHAVNAAVRAEVLTYARPATVGAMGVLLVLGFAAWRRRRAASAVVRTMAGARGGFASCPRAAVWRPATTRWWTRAHGRSCSTPNYPRPSRG